jgi:hypothetical protein
VRDWSSDVCSSDLHFNWEIVLVSNYWPHITDRTPEVYGFAETWNISCRESIISRIM